MIRRNSAYWVVSPDSRLTVDQQVGGALYDFIRELHVVQSNGTRKLLLSCLREDTGMNDRTLQKVFRGETDSRTNWDRVMCSLCLRMTRLEYIRLEELVRDVRISFYKSQGEDFLESQRQRYQPKRKNSHNPPSCISPKY